MRARRRFLPPGVAPAARVAAAATLVIAVVYVGCIAVVDSTVSSRLVAQVDTRLSEHLSDVGNGVPGPARESRDDDDVGSVPVFLWRAAPGRAAVPLTARAPALPARLRLKPGRNVTRRLGASSFRLAAVRSGRSLVVAGQSLSDLAHTESLLRDGELLAGPVLLLAVFAGSLVIGLRALSPVEQSRRRQLEFTADASHELRTPLSVISAETSIALSTPRRAEEYRSTLGRIAGESQRLRRIVEDLLWLARFDSNPPPPGDQRIDLAAIADECAGRFRAVAHSQSLDISAGHDGADPALISAPPEWIDRLAGVLMDNACRYAGPGGSVRISAQAQGNRVSLVVEDSGPGIPAQERPRLFDRFHRATDQGTGAGLGLAIADSIVRSTGGHWRIGTSTLGGARLEVCWRRSVHHGQAATRQRRIRRPSLHPAERRPQAADQLPLADR